jgi:hypothetical protein
MTRAHQHRAPQPAPLGTPERLAAYAFAVFCLITLIMDSPVQMAIAP